MIENSLVLIHWDGRSRWARVEAEHAILLPEGFSFGDDISSDGPKPLHVPLADLHLLVPLEPDARVFCVGRNFGLHAAEMGGSQPDQPNFFVRLSSSLVASGDDLEHPGEVGTYDFEGEIAFVIGRGGRRMNEAEARTAISGVTLLMDGSVRAAQAASLLLGKNYDRSGSLGPCIAPVSPGQDLNSLQVTTAIDGKQVQQGFLADTIFKPETLVSRLSDVLELRPGDVVSTGTPAGVGAGRTPPMWLTPGNEITVTCQSVGTLRNKVGSIVSGMRT